MAVFNPAIPEDTPKEWTNVSRPIEQPLSDKSTGLTLATLAQAGSSAVEIGKEIQEDIQKRQVRAGVEKLRDAYTDSLTKVRDQQIAGNIPNPQSLAAAGINTGTLAPDDQTNVPTGLQKGLDQARALGDAQS